MACICPKGRTGMLRESCGPVVRGSFKRALGVGYVSGLLCTYTWGVYASYCPCAYSHMLWHAKLSVHTYADIAHTSVLSRACVPVVGGASAAVRTSYVLDHAYGVSARAGAPAHTCGRAQMLI